MTPAEQHGRAADRSQFNQIAGDQFVLSAVGGDRDPSFSSVHTLRADTASFIGRVPQIESVLQATELPRGVMIYAIDGMPGVGKTTLANRLGHLVADRFPDAQFFVELHAHTPGRDPVHPQDALAGLLTATGLPPDQIPADLEDRAARWRDRLAGRRFLLILDNAAGFDQVSPLIPGASDCLVLVTSRRRMTGLRRAYGASILPLGVLAESEATQLLDHFCGPDGKQRNTADAVELVRLCGYLPLAITIVAAGGDVCDGASIGEVLVDLTMTQDRLSGIDSQLDDQELGVAAAFDLSYQRMSQTQQRVLRLLSLSPGVHFDAFAAAALTGLPYVDARRQLRSLRSQCLLESAGPERFRLHDLIALYARGRAVPEETAPALDRLFDYYQHVAARSNRWFPQRGGRAPGAVPPTRAPSTTLPMIKNQADAAGWLRTERANLIACLEHARSQRDDGRTLALTRSLTALLRVDGPWSQAVRLHTTALEITSKREALDEAAWTYCELGVLYQRIGDYAMAWAMQQKSLEVSRDLADREGEAAALTEMGILCVLTADFPRAADCERMAVEIYRQTRNHRGEAWALAQLGVLRRIADDWSTAEALLTSAAELFRTAGDTFGKAWTAAELANVCRQAGEYPEAVVMAELAWSTYKEMGDRSGVAHALSSLADMAVENNDFARAGPLLDEALATFREIGERHGEVEVLNHRGLLLFKTGDLTDAIASHGHAVDLARAIGNPHAEAKGLAGIARSRRVLCLPDEGHLQRAIDICRRIQATSTLAKLLAEQGAPGSVDACSDF